jgi:hypothetical protein
MVFEGVFNELSIEQAVALLSCFVHKEGSKKETPAVRSEMQAPFRHLQVSYALYFYMSFSHASLDGSMCLCIEKVIFVTHCHVVISISRLVVIFILLNIMNIILDNSENNCEDFYRCKISL